MLSSIDIEYMYKVLFWSKVSKPSYMDNIYILYVYFQCWSTKRWITSVDATDTKVDDNELCLLSSTHELWIKKGKLIIMEGKRLHIANIYDNNTLCNRYERMTSVDATYADYRYLPGWQHKYPSDCVLRILTRIIFYITAVHLPFCFYIKKPRVLISILLLK